MNRLAAEVCIAASGEGIKGVAFLILPHIRAAKKSFFLKQRWATLQGIPCGEVAKYGFRDVKPKASYTCLHMHTTPAST
jgi:hypothetical protein